MNNAVLGLTILFSIFALAQTQQETEVSAQPLSEQEFIELSQGLDKDAKDTCIIGLLNGRTAGQLLKVKDNYDEYVALQGSVQDWENAIKTCSIESSYYEILVNAKNQKESNLYRMRYTSYISTPQSFIKFNFYTPYFDQNQINELIKNIRALSTVKKIEMGNIQGQEYFQKVTVKSKDGNELVLASIEDRLVERTLECKQSISNNEEMFCENLSYAIQLKWIYNEFISYALVEGMEGAKYDSSVNRIVSVDQSKVVSIKDMRDIFPESVLLTSLKQDWIVRNSNKWTKFSKAKTWDQFWNFSDKQYYGLVSEFQSYSNRLNQQQVSKVMQCAQMAEKSINTNSGYACVQSKNGPAIYMFNYQVYKSTFQSDFEVSKMDEKAVYVKIPLMSESTGSAVIQMALPRKASDYFRSLQ